MTKNNYYVSAKKDSLDLGMVIEAENPYMAAIKMSSLLWDEFSFYEVAVTDVELVGMEVQND
ncbi:hypothetical protein [Streptococcus dysgalactiae]|uniref:hypothetical protein n=1 Tax=Streptococcus dysgalactiae TaxID=1334 RepID=UPI003A763FA4